MVDFVNVNIGHYKNSADFENMVHWAGAKTIITKNWGDKPFPVGGAPDFPADGDAHYLESSSDSCIKDAMQKKEEQMAALGSQIISGKGRYVASAETARLTSEGEYASLADIANSLSSCMTEIMGVFMQWATGNDTDVKVEYNTDYEMAEMPQGKLTELMAAVDGGKISKKTFFYLLKGYEMYPEGTTFEDEEKDIQEGVAAKVASREAQLQKQVETLMMSKTASAPIGETRGAIIE
jgi:hypothetical protein